MSFNRPEIVRPPSEWRSCFLPITSGCSNNTCAFCGSYGSKLQIRDVDDIKKEIDAVTLFLRSGVILSGIPKIAYAIAQQWDGERLFLQDSDALVYPFPQLREILQHLNERLPFIKRISSYATAQDILRRTPDELKELAELKLGILYTGLESGDDEVLCKMMKGVDSKQEIEAIRKAKDAGILTSVTVILGLGGVEGSEKHTLETARVLSEMDPDYVGALTLSVVPGTPLYREWQEGNFSIISPFQSLQELKTMIEQSNFTNCFFSSIHASNYFAVRGTLPRDKEKMISQLEHIIKNKNPSLLRPDFLRGL